ncbi:response regulator [Anaeromyxobacter oryzae]|uniref:Response regulatory domain-containing protein n=1 Tax=Anaeromyxobacter oryzae TaxID=2918170 RepID=A0ABM7X090_9BACT|nr:response regulator [Anaeromyxobacter oryzae]BDG05152.1 hypothetical protein AMOR_41480 [Anaeromyxobacter oryzae]
MSTRIVVIDDNEDAAATLRDLLALRGHDVRIATDGARGVETVLAFHPDVVVCDVGLPGMSGHDIARHLRAAGVGARLIALTGYGAEEDVARSREAGFDAHVTKPANVDELFALLRDEGTA